MVEALLFWFLALVTLFGAVAMLLVPNPIYAAMSLVVSMIGISGLFAFLGADFIAGVQVIVYAGAVLVLFVMVLMLFDLKSETQAFSKGLLSRIFKVASVGFLLGGLIGVMVLEFSWILPVFMQSSPQWTMTGVKKMAQLLFTEYMFIFQILGVLLLVVAVGAVALARSRGGTHERA
ncbi:MAG: NADH-quinone oxidoreductase subunit J [Bdellovibrionaceae bacterium]|nr:NADH-quinone oxidoreductase subunit J [Pseudobdellovibrionaceae bacterium]MDW8189372.1 NADH-quinone oxidoreductase subunit J [Pseudobdellovibrionaceae bacterium]